jgi:hypothetical protein
MGGTRWTLEDRLKIGDRYKRVHFTILSAFVYVSNFP